MYCLLKLYIAFLSYALPFQAIQINYNWGYLLKNYKSLMNYNFENFWKKRSKKQFTKEITRRNTIRALWSSKYQKFEQKLKLKFEKRKIFQHQKGRGFLLPNSSFITVS